MAVLKNRAKMSTSTTGTGTITLGSAESGYQTFADAGVANADVVRYVIEDTGGAFEIGTGTYTSSGTTLTRTVSESSNSDAAINLSGSATVFIGATAEDIQNFVASTGTATAPNDNVSIAIGGQAVASGTNSISLQRANSSGTDSIAAAIGNTTSSYGAHGSNSISIGALSKATALAGTAVGYGATSTHTAASAFGTSATTTANSQVALGGSGYTVRISGAFTLPTAAGSANQVLTTAGDGTTSWAAAGGGDPDLYAANESSPSAQPSATGANAIAIGDSSLSSGISSFSGPKSRAAGADSVAFGVSTNNISTGASNTGGVAIGRYAYSTGTDSISLGKTATSTSTQALALGFEATASNTQAVAIQASRATGTNSLAIQTEGPLNYGATGSYSIAIGRRAQSNSSYAVSIGGFGTIAGSWAALSLGYESSANGSYATVLGNRSTATAQSAVSIGTYAKSSIQGKLAYSGERFSATGDSQTGTFVLRCDTTDATPEKLQTTSGTQTVGTTNQVVLPNNSVYGFTGTIIARENSAQTNDFAVWEVKGGAVRAASASTTALGSYNINKISESTGAANWSIAISADTTNGAIAFTVTGEASHSIRWVATINTTEVTY